MYELDLQNNYEYINSNNRTIHLIYDKEKENKKEIMINFDNEY